jgi:hypothetical protein
VEAALIKLQPELASLAGALAAHGEPADAPFERFGVPSPAALSGGDAATVAAWAITLVHGVFAMVKPGRNLIATAKRVGNAALNVRRALTHEAARRDRIALREARPVGKKPDGAKLAA